MMIGIGTPSNQRSAPLAMIASVVVGDNGANLVGVPHPKSSVALPHKEEGPPEKRSDPLVNYDRFRWGKRIERSHKERSKQLHVP